MIYLIFGLLLGYISQWMQINLFISSLSKGKKPITFIKNKYISKFLFEKANVKVDNIKISESSLFFGAMVGIPRRPQLFLSRQLYEDFSKDELEYVVLHEAGHYKLNHSVKEMFIGILFFVIGSLILFKLPSLLFATLLGLFFGIVMIQIAKLKEIEADSFSLRRIDKPKGMITATQKLFKAWEDKSSKNPIIRFLFYRGNPYSNRIMMAETEIKKRKGYNN